MATHSDLTTCPRCGVALEPGFASRSMQLGFVKPEKFAHFAFVFMSAGENVGQARDLWKAEFFRAYLCRSCELHIVDYSRTYSREEASAIAATLT